MFGIDPVPAAQVYDEPHHGHLQGFGPATGRGIRLRSSLPPTLHGSTDVAIRKGLYVALAQATRQRDLGAPDGSFSGKPVPAPSASLAIVSPEGDLRRKLRHQKHFSASASLPQAAIEKDESLLRPPLRSFRTPTRAPAADITIASWPPATMAYPDTVQVLPSPQYDAYHRQNDCSAAGDFARSNDRPVEQSTEDFIMRTERSAARARSMQQQYQQQQQSEEYRPHPQRGRHQLRQPNPQDHDVRQEQRPRQNPALQVYAGQEYSQAEFLQGDYPQQDYIQQDQRQQSQQRRRQDYAPHEYQPRNSAQGELVRWHPQQEYPYHYHSSEQYPPHQHVQHESQQQQQRNSQQDGSQQEELRQYHQRQQEHHHQRQQPQQHQQQQRREQNQQQGLQQYHHQQRQHPQYNEHQQQQQQDSEQYQRHRQQQQREGQHEDIREQRTPAPVALQKPVSEPRVSQERLPEGPHHHSVYKTPRRISSGSNTSASSGVTTTSRESFESRMRSPIWSSQTSFESFYSAQSTARSPVPGRNPALSWQRPQPLKARRKSRPGELFASLPGEVLEQILDEVKNLHLTPGSVSCATCWMRDACSVALSARKWRKSARTALYEDIQLVGADSVVHRKKYKGVIGTRLVLLRRSLRANPVLAAMVRSLKVPTTQASVSAEEYENVVATVIAACPNLERVVGFYPTYDHSYGRFFQALSSRRRLKDMTWILQPSPFQRQQQVRRLAESQGVKGPQNNLVTLGGLQPQQAIGWLENHSSWRYLTSLTVHCAPGATLSPDMLLVDTMARLPALQKLHLSHLPHTAFNDAALLSLPPLKKLSLFHLAGISSAGLSAFATKRTSRSLESLTLVHLDIDSLPALARALSNLASLQSLSLVQAFAPVLPADDFIWLFPYLASSSLTRLHWDITAAVHEASAADHILAKSIAAHGFPSLRRLRAPADPEGVFQALCKPQEKADLPTDRYRCPRPGHSRTVSTASSHRSSDSGSRRVQPTTPTSLRFPAEAGSAMSGAPRLGSDLHQARLAAQARLEAARQQPRFVVDVTDENGQLAARFGLAGYIGDVTSKMAYHLLPDPGGLDDKGGLVDVADLLGDGGEDLAGTGGAAVGKKEKDKGGDEVKAREGCQGRWNTFSGAVIDKKDKERWFHTERGRWRGVALS